MGCSSTEVFNVPYRPRLGCFRGIRNVSRVCMAIVMGSDVMLWLSALWREPMSYWFQDIRANCLWGSNNSIHTVYSMIYAHDLVVSHFIVVIMPVHSGFLWPIYIPQQFLTNKRDLAWFSQYGQFPRYLEATKTRTVCTFLRGYCNARALCA